ncbi:MAG: PIN domain-containing protein [Anaerolineae bacterium]|nr:PIN domain-containing protein [Anaerolineae bacterium]
MADSLIDSNVLVDLLRDFEPAKRWIATQTNPAVSRIVRLEIIEGARNQRDLRRTLRLLGDFDLVELTTADLEWATQQLIRYRLSHNIGMMDCLIAAPASRLGLPLFTHNLKHFTPLLGPLAAKPY